MAPFSAQRAWWARPGVRARASDGCYLVLGAVDTVSGTHDTWVASGAARGLAAAVLGVLGTLAIVLLRRRAPFLVLLGCIPAMVVGGIDVTLSLALFALAVRRRDRVLVVGGLVSLAVFVVTAYAQPDQNWASGAVAGAIIVALMVAIGAFIGARRDLVASLRDRAEQAEATALLLQRQARLAERTLIAREMHDVVAHRISLVALHAGALEVNPSAGPEQVERAAALIRSTARQALEDLRGVLGVLRSDPDATGEEVALAPQPRLEDVPLLVEASVAAGVPVTYADLRPAGAAAVDEVVGRTVYRVVQEALTNVHKHARSATTSVVVRAVPDDAPPTGGPDGSAGVGVEVTNVRPVAGPALVPGAGAGLVGLRERVALAGGTLDCGPLPDGGWRVRATFPGRVR